MSGGKAKVFRMVKNHRVADLGKGVNFIREVIPDRWRESICSRMFWLYS